MKLTLTITAAIIGAVVLPAIAFAGNVGGCETVDQGGYSTFAEPGCVPSTFVGSYGKTIVTDADNIRLNGNETYTVDPSQDE